MSGVSRTPATSSHTKGMEIISEMTISCTPLSQRPTESGAMIQPNAKLTTALRPSMTQITRHSARLVAVFGVKQRTPLA